MKSPKSVKELKFIAHNSTLVDDFMYNKPIYVAALEKIVNQGTQKPEVKQQARGYRDVSSLVMTIHSYTTRLIIVLHNIYYILILT